MRLAKLKKPTKYWLGKKRLDMIGNSWNVGKTPWNKGKKCSYAEKVSKRLKELWNNSEYRNLMLKAHEDRIKGKGKFHYNWQGGKSYEPYSLEWTQKLKRLIRCRDNNKCHICKQEGKFVHHIDYDKKNCNPDNLITLCRVCHIKTNFNREKWKRYFIVAAATTK